MAIKFVSLDIFSDHSKIMGTPLKSAGVHLSSSAKDTLKSIIENELSPTQKHDIYAYYFKGEKIPEIAKNRGVNKSTVSRSIKSAKNRIGYAMKYGNFSLFEIDENE